MAKERKESLSSATSPNTSISPISQALGITQILPGESEELYRDGLNALVADLEAKTVFQVYLAEKIFDCLWWIRRYEEQKRATIIAEMAHQADSMQLMLSVTKEQAHIREALLKNEVDPKTLKAVSGMNHSIASLRQKVMEKKHLALEQLDQQIALQVKILTGLQSSYEAVTNRKIISERLRLQNELLRKDLAAIDITSDSFHHDKPKAG